MGIIRAGFHHKDSVLYHVKAMVTEPIAEAVSGVRQPAEVLVVVVDSVEADLAVAECVVGDVVNCQLCLYVV